MYKAEFKKKNWTQEMVMKHRYPRNFLDLIHIQSFRKTFNNYKNESI